MNWTLIFCLVLALPVLVANGAEVFVAPNGNDANAGTEAAPFATLERARDELRRLPADQAKCVTVQAGTYRLIESVLLDQRDSGTAGQPALWRAAPGAQVRLTGGLTVPQAAFALVSDPVVRARLTPAAQEQVRQLDLNAVKAGPLRALPGRFRGAFPMPELFCNDQRMPLSRWPNEGWAHIARVIDPGETPTPDAVVRRGGVFEYTGDQPARWRLDNGLWLRGFWRYDWCEETIQVKSIDTATRQIALAQPHIYSLERGNPSPRRWCAFNVLEEVDAPGEWSIDVGGGMLYFWPPADLAQCRVVLSWLQKPAFVVADAQHLILRGFTIEAMAADGLEVRGGNDVRVQACVVRNIRQLGVHIHGGVGHRVEACDIHDTGAGGLTFAGGDRKTLSPAGHVAVNNHIWRYAIHQLTYAVAIRLGGVGQRATNNLLHDGPHMAIGIDGNDHVFDYNVVRDVCTQTDDAGALYKGRNPSCRGNIIRHNFWHHIGSTMGHGTAAVYFDDGDGGDSVIGNVFYRCGDPGKGSFGTVFSHGGHDLKAEGNLFIECARALGSSPWDDKRWREALDGGMGCFWTKLLRQDVDITKPPYTTRYPDLVGFLDFQPGQPRVSSARNNAFVLCGQASGGNWRCDPKENWSTDQDPGFIDARHGDFRLRPDSPLLKALPEFAAIPMERMGLYVDELRPQVTPEPWPEAPLTPARVPGKH